MGLLKSLPKMVGGKTRAQWERPTFRELDDMFSRTSLGETRGNTPAVRGKYDTSKFEGLGGPTLEQTLDMSPQAIRARAAEQGFDVDTMLFHGRSGPIEGDALLPTRRPSLPEPKGVSFSRDPKTAEQFGDTLYPAYARGPLMDAADFMKRAREIAYEHSMPYSRAADMAQREFEAAGYTGAKWPRETTIFNAKDIRSPHAAFDPAKKDSSDLLAALALASLAGGGGLLSYARERRAPY